MSEIPLSDEQRDFLGFCEQQEVLKFDKWNGFILKSKRKSPWFFNAGNLMQSGQGLTRLARIYVDTLLQEFSTEGKVDTDIAYGPAYKWLPLATLVAAELYRQTRQNIGFASHRKEEKDHWADKGRGFGMNVSWKGSTIIDDVITAWTAAWDAVRDIHADWGTVNWMIVLLDRQEVKTPEGGDATIPPAPGEPRVSAIMDLEQAEWIRVVSALTFAHIRQAIQEGIIGNKEVGIAMDLYNQKYGVNI